ncbi:response regulator [Spirosoma koreense]
MTILVADDHTIIRLGLELYLTDILPDANIILCETFPDVLEALDKQEVDLIVLDIDMPGSENSQMIRQIREKIPRILILIYSGLDEKIYALPYIRAGADGYLSKNAPHPEFEVAITSLLNQGKYVSREVNQLMLSKLGQKHPNMADNPLQSLSPGERKVLQLLVEGKWTKDIASTLKLKSTTISTYRKKIFEKFEVTNITELMQKVNLFKHL